MRAHFSLVDDLIPWEEYEREVFRVIEESGGIYEERTAAMIVVRNAGRSHRKIADLAAGPSCIAFFGKVLELREPRQFERRDGTPGLVGRVLLGDISGEVWLVLWDEQALSIADMRVGEVLEIVGKLREGGEVFALDMQRTACDIPTRREPGGFSPSGPDEESVAGRIMAVGPTQTFTRRDGTDGTKTNVVVGGDDGCAVVVVWDPAIAAGLAPGRSYRFTGVRRNDRSQGVEYSLGRAGSVVPVDEAFMPRYDEADAITEGDCVSLSGSVRSSAPVREFTTRKGDISWVRNAELETDTGRVHLVLWGEDAKTELIEGTPLAIYNAIVKRGRYGDLEVHGSWGSVLAVERAGDGLPGRENGESDEDDTGWDPAADTASALGEPVEVRITGTVIDTAEGRCIDDGTTCYRCDAALLPGAEVVVEGMLDGDMILPYEVSEVPPDVVGLQERLRRLGSR
ncbi:hypothetical protein AZH53_03700 [Methanomicrobiaceae archaeon CYW5]|uniref:hypothetical protein n=1 Tax=Methanovulcanius yangii TaxID=1789227 RepID=UPI0029CA71D5|nr:hypothetical protein [Methanovulcanius yangii]MBT8507526.1 hypothetical protein [Methanovulcanius yangii]